MFGALVHVPLLVQWGHGTDATTAGLSLMTMSTGWSVGGLFAGQLLNRLGFRPLALAGATLMTLGYVTLALRPDVDWGALLVIGGATGIGMGLVSITLVVAVQNAIEPAHRGVATSGLLFFRNVGATLGVALMGAMLTARLGVRLAGLEEGARHLPPDLVPALVDAIGFVFWLGVGATVLTLVATCFLPDGTPRSATAAPPGRRSDDARPRLRASISAGCARTSRRSRPSGAIPPAGSRGRPGAPLTRRRAPGSSRGSGRPGLPPAWIRPVTCSAGSARGPRS